MRDIRKHIAWYLHGFPAGAELPAVISAGQKRIGALDALLGKPIPTVRRPAGDRTARAPRDRPASVALPEGWLADPDDCAVPAGADVMHSGG